LEYGLGCVDFGFEIHAISAYIFVHMICTFYTRQNVTNRQTLSSIRTSNTYRVVKKNGKREPRYLVEVPTHTDDYKKDDGDDTASNVKQILVSPKNVIHLTGQKPSPVPVLDQRLIFTGSMKSIIKVLNQSVHKIPTPSDIFEMRGFNLLSDEGISDPQMVFNMPAEQAAELEHRNIEMALMAKQWGKIQMRSYKCRAEDDDGDMPPLEDVPNTNGDATPAEEGEEDEDDTEEEGYNHLPPSYQSLQSLCPSMGRIHKICFNPKCYKVIQNPTSKQSKMKRCTKCNAVAYCNRECAIEAWDHHRKVCRVIQNDNAKFADYITLSSPKREEVMATQRMVRLCVNRIASLEDSDGHFQNKQSAATDEDDDASDNSNNNNTAKLVYDVMTQLGPDITNKILMMVENPPPPNREATVAVAFNSLGGDPIYSQKDIQLFANIHDCSVTYQQQQVAEKDDEGEGAGVVEDGKKSTDYTDIVTLEPNDDPLPGGGNIMGNVPDDVQEGFMNFMNGLVPGGLNGGMNGAAPDDGNNNGGNGLGGAQVLGGGMMDGQGGAQFFMPPMAGGGMMGGGGGPMDANVMGMMGGAAGMNIMMGGPAGGGAQQFFMPGQGAVPPANANGVPLDNDDDIPEMGEEVPLNEGGDGAQDAQADANPNNEANGNAANVANGNAAAGGVPPALANFLQHVLQETGVMPPPAGNNNNNEDNGDNANDDDEEDDDQPQVEDVADNNPNQQPQPQPQPNQGNFHGMFGGAHVHVAQVNANDAGAPPMPPPGAFFQGKK